MDKTSDQKLDELLEMMQFVMENGATQEFVKETVDNSINGLRTEMKENFKQVNERLDNVDAQLEQMSADLKSIKESLALLERKVQEDGDAYAADILKLRERVEKLERQMQEFVAGKLRQVA